MRLSSTTILALLPAFISANDQIPIKEKAAGWIDKAKAYVSSAAPEIPNPIDAGASKVAALKVEKLNIRNYQRKLGPKPEGEEEWLVYITGGNKTCHGRCETPDLAWNESVPLLTALEPFSGSKLVLASVNCEVDEILCTSWAVAVPSVLHFIFPQQVGSVQPLSPMHDVPLNLSKVETSDITSIPRASKATYLNYEEYTGAFHPVDGSLRKYGLLTPVGYILWGFGSTPSWLLMIGVSFISRQMMANKAGRRADAARAAGAGAPRAQAPAGGAGTGANVAAAAKGGSRKRK